MLNTITFKEYLSTDFTDVGVKNVENLTKESTKLLYKQLNAFEVKVINKFDLEMRENPFRLGTKFPDLLEAKDTVIKDFFTNYDKAKYTYDYGDGNEFTISIVKTYDFNLVPGVIEFAGKFPPEDVGFISGHFELVEAIKAGKNAT